MIAIPALIANTLLAEVLDYLKKGGESLVNNITAKKAIKKAIERAAERFGSEYEEKELARALTADTKFYDLPSVQKAIHELLEHPFDPAPQIRIENEFAVVLPERQRRFANQAAQTFFEILREELIGVEKLNDKLKLIYLKRTAEATERTADGIDKLVANHASAPIEVDKARKKYLQYIIDTNTYIDPRGIMQTRRSIALKLDEVYVSLTAEREMRMLDIDKLNERTKEDLDKIFKSEEIKQKYSAQALDRTEATDLGFAVKENQYIVILGDPGAGKTTLMRFLALQFAKSLSKKTKPKSMIDKDNVSYGVPSFPILLRIAAYAENFAHDKKLSLREFILNHIAGEVNLPRASLRALFENSLDSGDAIIMLDGLDEIVDEGDRAEIGRRIEQFVAGHAINRFIVTSRIAGYREAPLAGDFAHFTLRDMDRTQIKKFLLRWCPAAERSQTPDASEREIEKRANSEIDDILKSVEENIGVRRLASNPLLLTILALIHRNGTRLPSRRIELYELAAKTLLEDWELARGIDKEHIVTESEALRLLGPLAYWLHENKPKGIAAEKEIREKLAETLAAARGLAVDSLEIDRAVYDFLRRVRQHTGLLVERAPKQYGFMHLTFEEYFAARELIRRRADAAKKVYKYCHRPRWEEPILLGIAFLSNDYPEDAIDLIRTSILIEGDDVRLLGFRSSPYEDILHRDLLFTVRVLGDCLGIETVFSAPIISRLLSIYFDVDSAGRFEPLKERIETSLRTLAGNDLSSLIVSRTALEKLRNSDSRICDRAVQVLMLSEVLSSDMEQELQLMSRSEDNDIRQRALMILEAKNPTNHSSINNESVVMGQGLVSLLLEYDGSRSKKEVDKIFRELNVPLSKKELKRTQAALKNWRKDSMASIQAVSSQHYDLVLTGRLENDNVKKEIDQSLEERIDGLKKLIKDPDVYVRMSAVEKLGKAGVRNKDITAEVVRALDDENEQVCLRAADALIELGIEDTDAIVGLLNVLTDKKKSKKVIGRAINTLGYISPANIDLISELLILLEDNDGYIRAKAAETLGRLVVRHINVMDSMSQWKIREGLFSMLDRPQNMERAPIIKNYRVCDVAWDALWQSISIP